jgi:hypothetical protein
MIQEGLFQPPHVLGLLRIVAQRFGFQSRPFSSLLRDKASLF